MTTDANLGWSCAVLDYVVFVNLVEMSSASVLDFVHAAIGLVPAALQP